MSDSGEYYRIKCNFCDTILTVVEEQAGTEVKCPDCFSMLTVEPPPEGALGGAKKKSQSATGSSGDSTSGELKLSETFDRPAVSPLFGLDATQEDLLAPRKKKPPVDDREDPAEQTAQEASRSASQSQTSASSNERKPAKENAASNATSNDSKQDSVLDVDLPLPVDEVLSLDAIGKLDPESEPQAGSSHTSSNQEADKPSKQRKKKKSQAKSSTSDQVASGRPKFKYANLFMATVSMLTDIKVLVASGVAVLVMLIGGVSGEIIFPVGGSTEELTMTSSMYKYFMSFLFGNLPYYLGLLGLWTVAGIVFQHAAQGHGKVERWVKAGAGQSELLASFLLFGFSFFIAGLPAAISIFQILIIPMRVLLSPLFLISAWFNFSPWQIVSTDWYHSVKENKSQWITVYSCFAGLAFAGLLTGVLFWARSRVELVAIDLILTTIGIVSNAVITLVFAAIAGWHTGAVIESLDRDS